MTEYLIGIMYHDPESYSLWQRGIIEDYESSTGVFITASSEQEAKTWGDKIAEELLKFVNNDSQLTASEFGYESWVEHDIQKSGWSESIGFFQHVSTDQMPDLTKMTSEAYEVWSKQK